MKKTPTLLSISFLFFVGMAFSVNAQVDSVPGNALRFDGSTQSVDTRDTTWFQAFTVECWVKSPDAPSSLQGKGPVHYEKNFQINWDHVQSSARNSLVLSVTNGGWQAASFGPLQGNTWYHLAGTYDGDTLRAYTNGRLVTQKIINGGPPQKETFSLKIGKHAKLSGIQEFFRGDVDEVRVWDRALSPQELRTRMHHPLSGNENGLRHWYTFNQLEGDSVRNKATGRKAPLVNNPLPVPAGFPFGPGKTHVWELATGAPQTVSFNDLDVVSLEIDSVNRSGPVALTQIKTGFMGAQPDPGQYLSQSAPYWIWQTLDTGIRLKATNLRLGGPALQDSLTILLQKPSHLRLLNRSERSEGEWTQHDTCFAIAWGSGHFLFQNLPVGQWSLALPRNLVSASRLISPQSGIKAWVNSENKLVVESPSREIHTVQLVDIRGRRIASWEIQTGQSELALPPLPHGMYGVLGLGSHSAVVGKLWLTPSR